MKKHPDAVFGKDTVSFADVAAYVRSLDTSALTFADYADIIAILTYMRDEQIKINDRLNGMGATLDEREADLTRREKELAVRMGAVELMLKGREPNPAPRRYFWR
jgi:hypothetical protein